MEKKINVGSVVLQVLKLLIVKPFTLPWKIYHNTLINLSNSDDKDSLESTLSKDFPLFVYTIDYYDALIALLYPLGLLVAIIGGIEGGFGAFLVTVIATYFSPLFLGLFKELISITLKNLQYLKMISNK
tara:strand:- start:254 stop:640 length:387 start_codon:yes stop_codon:yes gene_type:complete